MKKITLIFLLLPLLASCSRFRPVKLHKQIYTHAHGSSSTASIQARAHLLETTDRSPINEHSTLVSLTITNTTAHPCLLDTALCLPHCMSAHDIANLTPTTYGCYFVPAIALACASILFTWQIGLPLAGVFTLCGVEQSRRAADRTQTSFVNNLLDPTKPLNLAPHSTQTILIAFDKKNYTPSLHLSIATPTGKESCLITLVKKTETSYTII